MQSDSPVSEPLADFGRYRPSAFCRSLITLSQGMPRHWLGQQVAQLVRKVVLLQVALPVDVTVGALRMRCFLQDNSSEKKFVFMPWRFDRRERELLVETLPRDGVFVDVGANVGIYSLTAATHLGPRGRILAIEPNPPAFQRLRFNLEATRGGNPEWPEIDAVQVGVADVDGTLDLHLDPRNLGSSSIVVDASAAGGTVRIPVRPMLALLQERNVTRIDALKIDIEGAEDLALMPFLADAPDRLLPRLMIIENSERQWKGDLVGSLRRRGYSASYRSRMNTVYRRA